MAGYFPPPDICLPKISINQSISQSVDFYSVVSGATTAGTAMSVDDVKI